MKPQHGYEIFDKETGDVVKPGISGQPLNKNRTSPRANRQLGQLNKEAGHERFGARVVKEDMKGRAIALEWEREHASELAGEGHSLNRHLRPKPKP